MSKYAPLATSNASQFVDILLRSLGRLGVISASFPTHQQVDGCEHNNGDDEGHGGFL
jgi:hypothetical protein